MDNYSILNLKKKGYSNRRIAKILGIDKKTVNKYWNSHLEKLKKLEEPGENKREIQESIISPVKYNVSGRRTKKFTVEMDKRLDDILLDEETKTVLLGRHKQKLTKKQIYNILKDEGHDISYPTIVTKINEKIPRLKECFIKQSYEYGQRLEYDFGEVKLVIDGKVKKYYLAVLSSPASNFRWAYLYSNQKKDVFLDSHVKFFEMTNGVYREVVYDNMRNVVSRFIGKNEKLLNEDLIKMSMYYGFDINVTNCFSGNEKGHVEGSVKVIRNRVYAIKYRFDSFDAAQNHLENELIKLNADSRIEEEKNYLLEYKPKLEIADININKVNKYSFIRFDNNSYSVPEYLVNKQVTIKSYYDEVLVYSNNNLVCKHKRIDGQNNITIDIRHYLNSMKAKSGSIKNSLALKSIPELQSIYEKYFNTNPKKFIELLNENKEKTIKEIIEIVEKYAIFNAKIIPIDKIYSSEQIDIATREQVFRYNDLCIRGDN